MHVATNGLGTFPSLVMRALTADQGDPQATLLCHVRTLEVYLQRTQSIRSQDQKRLIIPYHRGATNDLFTQSISTYIRQAILLAYREKDLEADSIA